MKSLIIWLNRIISKHKALKRWKRIVTVMAAIITFATTYALILPAITVEKNRTDEIGGMYVEQDESRDDMLLENAMEPIGVTIAADHENAVTFAYTDDAMTATAIFSTDEQIPEDAELVVNPVDPESEEYMSLSSRSAELLDREFIYDVTTCSFYDFALVCDNVDVTPETGLVDIQIIFHNNTVEHVNDTLFAGRFTRPFAYEDGFAAMAAGGMDAAVDTLAADNSTADNSDSSDVKDALVSVNPDESSVIELSDGIITVLSLKGNDLARCDSLVGILAGNVDEEIKAAAAETDAEIPDYDDSREENDSADSTDTDGEEAAYEDSTEADGEEAAHADSAEADGEDAAPAVKTLKAAGNDYTVTLTYDATSEIPAGASLNVSEIAQDSKEYKNYLEKTKKAMGLTEEEALPRFAARFFDIKIMVGGKEFTPESGVSVEITYAEPLAENPDTEVNAVHFANKKADAEMLDASTSEVQDDGTATAQFTAESFSVYGVIYTVDFHWEVDGKTYEFSLPGGGYVSLTKLIEALGVADAAEKFVADVEKVEFSTPCLMSVSKVKEDTTVGAIKDDLGLECRYSTELTEEQISEINNSTIEAGDWALISVQPFISDETLTVTMKDGEQFAVKVTDAQMQTLVVSDSGKIYKVTVTYDEFAEIPEGSRLVTRQYAEDEDEFLSAKASLEKCKKETVSPAGTKVGENGISMMAFDISILGPDKTIIEPKSTVFVSIELFSFPEGTDAELAGSSMEVHHIVNDDGKESAVLVADARNISEGTVQVEEKKAFAKFLTDSFSVYTINWGYGNNARSVRLHFVNEAGTELTGVKYNGTSVDGQNITLPNPNGLIQFDANGELDLEQFTVDGKTLSSTHRGTPKNILPGVDKPTTSPNTNAQQPHSIIGNTLKWNGSTIQYEYFYTNSDKADSVWMDAGYRPRQSDKGEPSSGLNPDPTPVYDGNINYEGYTTYDYFLVYSPEHDDSVISADQHGETPEINGVGKNKQLEDNTDGTYTLKLSVDTEAKKDDKFNDVNIILVLDTSSSMRRDANDRRPNEQGYDVSTRRMKLTASALEAFVEDLKKRNTTENDDAVEMALITFNAYAEPSVPLTNNLESIKDKAWEINGGIDENGSNDELDYGTNWADGLRYANEMTFSDNDPTFVLFLTDGAPSEYWAESEAPGGSLLFVDGGGSYLGAREEGRALASGEKAFYAVFSFGTEADKSNDYLGDLVDYSFGDNVRGQKRFYADDGDELLEYLKNILSIIDDTIGHTGVNYQDGIAMDTTSTALHTNLNGPLGNITYKKIGGTSPDYTVVANSDGSIKSFKVAGVEQTNTSINPDFSYNKISGGETAESPITITESTAAVYQCTVGSGDNAVTYTMPMATLDIDPDTKVGDLNWDLSPLGILEDGATYEISFVVWPDQEAYNYVADLNNGKKLWDYDHDTEVTDGNGHTLYYKDGIYDDNGDLLYPNIVCKHDDATDTDTFAVLTNTMQDVTYYTADQISGEETTYEYGETQPNFPPPMPLIHSQSKVQKLWSVDRDPGQLAQLLYDSEGNPKYFTIGFDVYQDVVPETNPETGGEDDPDTPPEPDPTLGGDEDPDEQPEPYTSFELGWIGDHETGQYVWDPDGPMKTVTYGKATHVIGTSWNQEFSIAAGIMLSYTQMLDHGLDTTAYPSGEYKGTTYYILEPGHDYRIVENSNLGYEFDKENPVYHPMLVDGDLQNVNYVKLDGFDSPTGDAHEITIEGMTTDIGGIDSLKITNTLRGYINLQKVVVDKDGVTELKDNTQKFTYHIDLTSPTDPGPFEGEHIPWYGVNGLFYHDGDYNYYQAVEDDPESNHLTLTTEAGETYDAYCADPDSVFDDDIVGPTHIYYYTDPDDEETRVDIEELFGNQLTCSDSRHASAIMELSRTEILNISNVPIETEYTIQEIQETGYDLISIVKEIRNGTIAETRTRVKDLSTGTITGKIVPDRDNHIIFTNKIYSVDITVEKFDENQQPMTGAVFTLIKARSGDETEDTVYTKPDEEESDTGVYKFTDLPDGSYTLSEMSPVGYATIGGVTFTVDHGIVSVNNPLPAGVSWDGENFVFTVVNTPLDNPGSITVRKQWLDFFGNAMSYDGTLDLKLVQWAPGDLPEHTVTVYLRCTGNGNGGMDVPGQITNIANRSWTGSGDVLFFWDWNRYTALKVDGGDATFTVDAPEGVDYEPYATTQGRFYNVDGGVPKGKRQYIKFSGITKDIVVYVNISNNRYSGIDNPGIDVHALEPAGEYPLYGPLEPTGGTKTVTLGTGGTWIQSFNISGNGLLSDSSTTLPATYTQNGKTKPCYYTISEEDIPPGYDLEQISTDTVQAGVLTAYNRRNTVDLLVEKVDKEDTAVRLNGATFTLRQIDPEKEGSMDTRTLEGGRTETQTTSGEGSDEGTLTFDSLGEGYYEIKETKAPSNYILSADTAFYIRIVGHQVQLLQKDVHKSAKSWKVIAADYSFISVENATATVFNSTGAALPHTGGPGTAQIYLLGLMITGLAGAGLMMRKRRKTA